MSNMLGKHETAALLSAGLPKAYLAKRLSDYAGGERALDMLKSRADVESIRTGMPVVILSRDPVAADDVTYLFARGLMLKGVGCSILDTSGVLALAAGNLHAENRTVVIPRFVERVPCPWTPRERYVMASLLADLMGARRPVVVSVWTDGDPFDAMEEWYGGRLAAVMRKAAKVALVGGSAYTGRRRIRT